MRKVGKRLEYSDPVRKRLANEDNYHRDFDDLHAWEHGDIGTTEYRFMQMRSIQYME
jgi:hypothetical protein